MFMCVLLASCHTPPVFISNIYIWSADGLRHSPTLAASQLPAQLRLTPPRVAPKSPTTPPCNQAGSAMCP